VFLKAPHQVQSYKQHFPDASLPSKPVPTRWGTWIKAVNFYSEHIETVKSIVDKFPSESAVLVREFSNPKVVCSIAYIRSNFDWLPEKVKCLETQGLPLQESMGMMKNASEKITVVKGEAGEKCVHQVAGGVKKKPWIFSIYQCLSGT
jgi:hypothetical protein